MKKILNLFLLLSCVFFYGCIQEDMGVLSEDTLYENVLDIDTNNPVVQDIITNVLTSKYGGYDKTASHTRSSADFTITPYIQSGDTLMYIVQYPVGWEVYSATKAAPMLLFSCPKGVFDMANDDMPIPVKDIFNSTADNLRTVIRSKVDTINPTWSVTYCTPEELNSGKIIIDYELLNKINSSNDKTGTRSEDPEYVPEEGYWVLLNTEVVSMSTYISPKLIQTKWGQESPWNQYTPKKYNSETLSYENALVGCVAVAVGQYQFYTHYKDEVPLNTVSTVTATSNGLDYTFSGSSSTIWDNMAKIENDSGEPYSAMLMGYLGKQMSASYGLKITEITPSKMEKYLENTYGVDFYSETPSFDVISKTINKSYPIIASGKDPDNGSHCFLIDQYKSTSITIKYTYGWEGPYKAPGSNVYVDTNDRDEDGIIIGWAIQNEIVRTSSAYQGISMNWGFYGDYDDKFYFNLDSWSTGDYTFDTNLKLWLRDDLNY